MLGVDCVRFIAAIWIVWVHSVKSDMFKFQYPTLEVGRFGTRLFSTLAAYFLVRHILTHPGERWPVFARSRFERIYIPFAVWSLVYILARILNWFLTGHKTSLEEFRWEFLWIGTTYHLWFLPQILCAGIMAYPFARWASKPQRRVPCGLLVFAIGWVVAFLPVPSSLDPVANRGSYPAMLFYITPSFLWGLAIGLTMGHRRDAWVGRWAAWGLAIFAVACITLTMVYPPDVETLPTHRLYDALILRIRLIGLAVAFLAFANWSGLVSEVMARLGRLSMGVYLCHLLFVEGLHSLTKAAHIPMSPWNDVGVFAVSISLAFFTSWLLIRHPRTAWLAR